MGSKKGKTYDRKKTQFIFGKLLGTSPYTSSFILLSSPFVTIAVDIMLVVHPRLSTPSDTDQKEKLERKKKEKKTIDSSCG